MRWEKDRIHTGDCRIREDGSCCLGARGKEEGEMKDAEGIFSRFEDI